MFNLTSFNSYKILKYLIKDQNMMKKEFWETGGQRTVKENTMKKQNASVINMKNIKCSMNL